MPVLLRPLSLIGEQLLLSLQSPAITTETLVLANDAMTGNDQRDRIGGAGTRHRPHGLLLANCLGHVAVGISLSHRTCLGVFPTRTLEGRRPDVERQLNTGSLAFKMIYYCLRC